MSVVRWIFASLVFINPNFAAAADVDLICADSKDSENFAHVRIDGQKAVVRYVTLGEEKDENLDYTFKKANDSTLEYQLKESARYFYWYDLSDAGKFFSEPENVTLEGLLQSFSFANETWEAREKEANDLGIFVNSSNMIVIDRSKLAFFSYWDVRSSVENLVFSGERSCNILSNSEAEEFMDSKFSDFKEIEADSIESEKEDAATKF